MPTKAPVVQTTQINYDEYQLCAQTLKVKKSLGSNVSVFTKLLATMLCTHCKNDFIGCVRNFMMIRFQHFAEQT